MGVKLTIRVGGMFISVETDGETVVYETVPPLEPPPGPREMAVANASSETIEAGQAVMPAPVPVVPARDNSKAGVELERSISLLERAVAEWSAHASFVDLDTFRAKVKEVTGARRLTEVAFQRVLSAGAGRGLWHSRQLGDELVLAFGPPPREELLTPSEELELLEQKAGALEEAFERHRREKHNQDDDAIEVELAVMLHQAGLDPEVELRKQPKESIKAYISQLEDILS